MEMDTPLPSYAVIYGKRVKECCAGQKKTCARCNQSYDDCGGNANAKHCEEKGGEKTKTEEMW